MKYTTALPRAAMVACLLLLGAGCVVYERPPAGVVVAETPPEPPTEVIPVAPGPEFVWIGGVWVWQGRWVWQGGHWGPRPRPGAVWVAGRWERGGRGYVWRAGRWR